MCPGLFWWIWSPAPWTAFEEAGSEPFSDLTTSSMVRNKTGQVKHTHKYYKNVHNVHFLY